MSVDFKFQVVVVTSRPGGAGVAAGPGRARHRTSTSATGLSVLVSQCWPPGGPRPGIIRVIIMSSLVT